MKRRNYLAALAALTSGCAFSRRNQPQGTASPSDTPTATPEPSDSEYETVIDLQERGADPTGTERIDPLLAEHSGSDTKLTLPKGRYLVDEQLFRGFDQFALVGEDATLVPEQTGSNIFLSFKQVSDLHVEGLTVDQTSSDQCGWMDIRCVGGKNVVRDITLDGFIDIDERTNGFTLLCEGTDTELVLEDIDISDGARYGAGVYTFPQQSFFDPTRQPGSITLRNCHMSGWGKEGLYASPHGGPLSIIGGRYENNAIVQVRIGGGNADNETIVRDVTVVVDDPPDYIGMTRNGNFRGIWFEEGDKATVEGCTVEIRDTGGGFSQGGIIVNNQFGRATIQDTTIRTDENVPALRIKSPGTDLTGDNTPGLDKPPSDWNVTCSNVQIEGTSGTGAAIHLRERDDCLFEDVSIDQTNGTRNGLLSVHSAAIQITGGRWVTAGYPVLLGSTDRASDRPHVLCVENYEEFRSTRFDGEDLETQGVDGEDRTCIPLSILPEDESGERTTYVGLTSVNDTATFGHSVRADWDGRNLARR